MSPGQFVIEKLGGLTRTAGAIKVPVTTVQGWKERGRIPQEYWKKLIEAAAERGETIELNDFITDHADPAESIASEPAAVGDAA